MARLEPKTYRTLWRWHFIVGLLVAPVLIVLATTGALYLFDRELQSWWNRDIAIVRPAGPPTPLAVQAGAVTARFPNARFRSVKLPRRSIDASEWTIDLPDGRQRMAFVDPYRAIVTGDVDPARQPLEIARRLHAGLMLEPWGRYIVELTAGWTLVMLTTGVALWWPSRWRLRGVVMPRLRSGWTTRWRDLHAVPAALTAVMTLFLVSTGMPWSIFFGEQLGRLGSHLAFVAPSPQFGAPPPQRGSPRQGATPHDAMADPHAQHHPIGTPWTLRHTPIPRGSGGREIGIADLEPLLARFDTARWGGGIRIFYPNGPDGVFWIVHVPDNAEGQHSIFVDPGDGRVLREIGWRDYSPGAKAIEWGVMTHTGREYGLPNQLVNLAVCLAILGFVTSGLVLWWRRRPSGRLMRRSGDEGSNLPRTVLIPIVVIAILLPPTGLTLVIGLALDRLIRTWSPRRISRIA